MAAKLECMYCGKQFYRRHTEARKGKRTFCSRKCYNEYRKENPQEFSFGHTGKELRKIINLAKARKERLDGEC